MKKLISTFLILILSLLISACSTIEIIERPINFSEKRIELTKQYINTHYGLEVDNIEIEPKIIVLHWTAVNDLDSTFEIFDKETLENSRPDLQSNSNVNVGIQFMVDRDGKIYRLMNENWMARHVIGINYNSIGVENIGGGNNIDNLTDEQVEANIKLVKYLKEKYPSIEYLIGHHEYQEFENHQLWLEKDKNYRTKKYDPGERFMSLVRNGTEELNLKGVAEIRAEITNP